MNVIFAVHYSAVFPLWHRKVNKLYIQFETEIGASFVKNELLNQQIIT